MLLIMILMLSFSSAAFGMQSAGLSIDKPPIEVSKPNTTIPETLENPENPEEKVRIIVELEGAPTIEQATEKGVLYKDLRVSERKMLESKITTEQANVQNSVESVAPSIEILENFTTVFNGFSAEVEAKYVEKIAATNGVKAVYESTEYERPTEKPEMIHSKELVQAQRAWNEYGFRGEGMVVGVIDSGIDPSHKDMVLTDNSTAEITKEEVDGLLANGSIKNGGYYTAKVPFGYNYMDGNNQILDLGPDATMHGMHVGGTVAANGSEEDGGIKGVAPEAQILALKVFGNDPGFPSTYGDIYIKAIDDSIKLGVDVINMSLGATAGFVDDNNPEQQAVQRATENGILVAISAGNSAFYGNGYFYPYAENQDYGLTGSPSVSHHSLGVASFENKTITAYSFSYQIDGTDAGDALYLLANDQDPIKTYTGPMELVDAGLGGADDFAGKDVNGKIALVKRGTYTFVDKALNAQAAGAAGIIIYNNAAGTINMASDPAIKIPYMFALQTNGEALKTALTNGSTVTVSFEGNFVETPNANAGKMSDFSSWGPTPNLDFKPEITAPGGNIFSTLNDNQYGLMSGTSMAAPHVAGGTTLVLERIDQEFNLSGSDRVQLAKNLLMNTSAPVELAPGEYVSPRRQGSGLMQLANALSTDVVVTNENTNEPKVALKEIKNNTFTFTLNAKNYSDEEKTFNVHTQIQMDAPVNAGDGLFVNLPNTYGQIVLTDEDIDVTAPETVTIPANGTAPITVSVDTTDIASFFSSIYTNGFFVDGFVTLTDPNEEVTGNVPLTVPFFGFNGEWDDAPIFDYFAWDSKTFWGYTALADEQGSFITGGGNFDSARFGFSPNGDGVRDKAIPVFSLFRNAKEFKVQVLDKDGKVLRTLRTANELRKHYTNTTANPYTYNLNYGWDGKINNKLAADGDYVLQVSGVIDYEGAEWQTLQYPVKVDTKAPSADVGFDVATNVVSIADFTDSTGGTGVEYWQVFVNGKAISDKLTVQTASYIITAPLTPKDEITVQVVDAARNIAEYPFNVTGTPEKNHPVIYIDSPEFFDGFNTSLVDVVGRVEDESKITSVTVNEQEATFDGLNFSHTLTLKDGVQDIRVKAIDEFKNEMQIARKVIVDTTAPTLSIKNNYVKNTKEQTATVNITVKDNFDEVRVTVNGDERFYKELSEPYAMKGYTKDLALELALVDGDNEFTIEVEDIVGNKTTKTITIKKTASNNGKPDKPGNGNGNKPGHGNGNGKKPVKP